MKEQIEGTMNPEQQTLTYGMPTFLIKIVVPIPYPKQFDYREQASSIGTAINRAISKMRKALHGKRVKEVSVKAVRI